MRAYDVIYRKREGRSLSEEEIRFLVEGYTRGEIPDYQMSAFLMAVFFRGMTDEETAVFTRVMMESGDVVDLSGLTKTTVDKHSTGGVGDKVSLVLAPLVASAGAIVPMMSGRGLAHTGGTLDKLESIPGYRTDLSTTEYIAQLNEEGVAITGQTGELAPADRKMYALRDVTATVDSIPLIAGSIMSKKLAAGPQVLVLDVKTGNGAFMSTFDDAERMARTMVQIAERNGRRATALITDMEQPLGRAVGNALEVAESVMTLHGEGPPDLEEISLRLGATMLTLGGYADNERQARDTLYSLIEDGLAFQRFRELVRAQGGDVAYVDEPGRLPKAPVIATVDAPNAGFVGAIDTLGVGLAAVRLGAGRERVDSPIDPAVGFIIKAKVGDQVETGTPLVEIHAASEDHAAAAASELLEAYTITDTAPVPRPLIFARVTMDGTERIDFPRP